MTASAGADDPRRRVLDLVRLHGFNTTSFQALESGLEYWWSPDGRGCVAYADTGGAWVAAGAPIAPLEELPRLVAAFVDAARVARKRVCLFAAQQRLLESAGLAAVPIGLQFTWDPQRWNEHVLATRSLRQQLRRAERKGVVVRLAATEELRSLDAPLRVQAEALVRAWLDTRRMTPLVFVARVEPFEFLAERRIFVAHKGDRLVGLASAVPVYARAGWFLEDVVRATDAPNGTTELLIDACMRQAASEGSSWAALGLAPLAGPVPRWMRTIGRLGRPLYDFSGLERFRQRLRPMGSEVVYLAHPKDVAEVVAVSDTLRAFADGSLPRFVARMVLEGRSAVLSILAWLLVPWTIVLLLVPLDPWFPTAGVRLAWVALDVGLIAALLQLARRHEPRLAIAIAAVTGLDAVGTLAQALLWSIERVRGAVDVIVLVVACLAPLFACVVVTRGWARQRRSALRTA